MENRFHTIVRIGKLERGLEHWRALADAVEPRCRPERGRPMVMRPVYKKEETE